MISKKVFNADGANKRFLSDFIIQSEQFVRVYAYIYDITLNPDGTEDKLQNGSTDQADWSFPDNIWKRGADVPDSGDDLITIDKWDLVTNSILMYDIALAPTKIWLEVATTPEEFGDTLTQPSVQRAEDAADSAVVSANNASTSETNTATSASNASTSEINAATSASNASTSETNASTSETNASTSETNAATSASNAGTSETNAATSASNASTSETNAATSASNASTSETNAATSASNAASSAELVIDKLHTVGTIAELLLVDIAVHTNVNVLGYYAINDGGGGIFNYDNTQSTTNNGGTILDGWIRQYKTKVNALWFGIKNDNLEASAPANTLKLQALFDLASNTGWQLYFPNGYYTFDSQLIIKESLRIEGEGISKSRSTTGNVNDRGFILKYVGAITAGYLVIVQDDELVNPYMYGSHLQNIRLDCGGQENGMLVRGVNEGFNMEDIEVGNYKYVGLEITRDPTTLRVNNQATFRRIKLVPSSTIVGTAIGLKTSYAHRLLFEAITVDAQGSDSTVAIHRGFTLGKDTRNCTFINCYAENCTVGFQLGADLGGDNDTVMNNVFINPSIEAPEFVPADSTINGITSTFAFIVQPSVKWYSILGLYQSKSISTPATYGYTLYDNHQKRGVSRTNTGTTSERLSFVTVGENKYGKQFFKTDAFEISDVAVATPTEFALAVNNTYPNVNGGNCFKTANTSATSITGFDNGTEGQIISIRSRDSNTSIQDGNSVGGISILLAGGVDITSFPTNSTLTLVKRGGAWIELSRMIR